MQRNGKTSCVCRLRLVKMSMLPQAIYRFYPFSIKNVSVKIAIFEEIEKNMLECIWNLKGSQVAKTILKRTKLKASRFLI